MRIEGNTIYADEGMVLRRKEAPISVGREYALGYIYYDVDGNKLPEPKLEVPSDFEDCLSDELYAPMVERLIRRRYSLSSELAIQRQRDVKVQDFQEYFDYCEQCKEEARSILFITD